MTRVLLFAADLQGESNGCVRSVRSGTLRLPVPRRNLLSWWAGFQTNYHSRASYDFRADPNGLPRILRDASVQHRLRGLIVSDGSVHCLPRLRQVSPAGGCEPRPILRESVRHQKTRYMATVTNREVSGGKLTGKTDTDRFFDRQTCVSLWEALKRNTRDPQECVVTLAFLSS